MLSELWKKYEQFPVQVRASVWFLICSFLQKGISVITIPIITRLLTTVEYGQYSVFDSWLRIITIIVTLQIYSGVYVQGMIKYSDDRKVYSSTLQGLTIVLTAMWTVIYIAFHSFWNSIFSLTTVQMLAMLVMIWATAAFNFWASEQRVEYKYRRLVIATLIVSIAKPVVGIAGILAAHDKVTAYILSIALVELVGYVGFFIAQMHRGKSFYSKKYWLYALKFNIPLVPHYLSQSVLSSADRIMIKSMVGASAAGIYSLAYSLALVMTLFNTSLMQAISPWMYQKIKDNEGTEIAPIAYTTLIMIACVNLLLILLAPEAVALFAPKEYYDAIWVVPPVAMSVFFMYSYDLFAKFAFYYEKSIFIMFASVLGASLNIALNYICINQFGYIAAGYTTLACYIIFAFAHYAFMIRVCNQFCNKVYPYETKKIMTIDTCFLLAGFSLIVTYTHPIIRYGIVGLFLMLSVIFRKKIKSILSNVIAMKTSI